MPLWQGLVLSFSVDLLLPSLTKPRVPLGLAVELATSGALVALPFVDQQRVHRVLSRLRSAHKKGLSNSSTKIPLAMIIVAASAIVAKSIALIGASGVIPAIAVIIMLGGAVKHAQHAYQEGVRDRESLKGDAWSHVQRWEHQLVIVSLVPMLLARGISLCGALAMVPPDDYYLRVIFFGAGLLFILMLKPQRAFFLSSCSRCKQPVPIVLSDLGCCLGCDEDLREKFARRNNK